MRSQSKPIPIPPSSRLSRGSAHDDETATFSLPTRMDSSPAHAKQDVRSFSQLTTRPSSVVHADPSVSRRHLKTLQMEFFHKLSQLLLKELIHWNEHWNERLRSSSPPPSSALVEQDKSNL